MTVETNSNLKPNLQPQSNDSGPELGTYVESSGTQLSMADASRNDLTLTKEDKDKLKFLGRGKKNKKGFSANAFYLSYPIARTPSESTGDTLLIKCIEYQPPQEGFGLGLETEFVFAQDTDGNTFVPTRAERQQGNAESNPFFEKDPSIKATFTQGQQRMLEKQDIKFYVELPAPQEINDSNTITWGEDTLNALEIAGLEVGSRILKEGGGAALGRAREGIQALNAGVKLGNLDGDVQRAINASISGAALGTLGSNVSQRSIISRGTGQILNSNTELLFQGVNLRTFPFTVTFTPRDKKEAEVVKAIIRNFKQAMAPTAGDFNGSSATGIFLKAPKVFDLRYMHYDTNGRKVDHPFLNKFKICALTGMSVNYTNAGTYSSYNDGTPVAIRMNMTFKEINPIYSEDYTTPEGRGGVGY